MTVLRNPRSYWSSLSDTDLSDARAEYAMFGDDEPWLAEMVAEIDDELERRADYRRRGGDAA